MHDPGVKPNMDSCLAPRNQTKLCRIFTVAVNAPIYFLLKVLVIKPGGKAIGAEGHQEPKGTVQPLPLSLIRCN